MTELDDIAVAAVLGIVAYAVGPLDWTFFAGFICAMISWRLIKKWWKSTYP